MRTSLTVFSLATLPFLGMASVAAAQGLGSANPGSDDLSGIPRAILDVDLTPGENMRGLPQVGGAEIDDFLSSYTRAVLSEDEQRKLFGTVTRSRDGSVTEAAAADSFFTIPQAPALPEGEQAADDGAAAEDFAPRSTTPSSAKRIMDGKPYPYRSVGLLVMYDAQGDMLGHCSGALIGPSTVLTAAHCFYNHEAGWVDDVRFIPGLTDLGTEGPPFGVWGWTNMSIPNGYVSQHDGHILSSIGYDIAVLHLDQDVGTHLGWLPVWMVDDRFANFSSNLVGYPGDMPFGTMWWMGCPIEFTGQHPKWTVRNCVTAGGTSGGPMYMKPQGADDRIILSINVAGNDFASIALTIDDEHFRWLSGLWK